MEGFFATYAAEASLKFRPSSLMIFSFYKHLFFTFENGADISKALLQAYVLAKQNSLNATFTREEKFMGSWRKMLV